LISPLPESRGLRKGLEKWVNVSLNLKKEED